MKSKFIDHEFSLLCLNFWHFCAAIAKKQIKSHYKKLIKEVKQLEALDHPNVSKYIESYENEKTIYIVMEFFEGKQLFDMITDRVSNRGTFSEYEVGCHTSKLMFSI